MSFRGQPRWGRKISRVWAAAIGTLTSVSVSLLLPGTAWAGAVDQRQEVAVTTLHYVNVGANHAQTFTAGKSGALDRIDLSINSSSANRPLIVEIRSVTAGRPTATVLTSAELQPAQVLTAWTPVHFSSPVQVWAGSQYAIVLRSMSGVSYGLRAAAGDVYGGGTSWTQLSLLGSLGLWGEKPNDLAFRTYVHSADPAQEQISGGSTPIDDFGSLAQTFTAGITGDVDQVDLYLNRGGAFDPMRVEIRDVDATGMPGATVLASGDVAPADAPAGWFSVHFPSGVRVQAGQQYAIVSYMPVSGHPNRYLWFGASGDVYAGGAAWLGASPPSAVWRAYPQDLAFRVYVNQ